VGKAERLAAGGRGAGEEAVGRRIEAVILDMDGLMFDTERLAVEGWRMAGGEFGIEMPYDLVLSTVGTNTADTREILERGLGRKIPFDEMRARRFVYLWDVIDREGVPVKKGLGGLLDLLEGRSVPAAVATSTERGKTEKLLRMSGLYDRFQVLVCGDEVARGKPAPDIFLAAAAGLDVQPGRCVVLEDSASGIRAAHAAGMIPLLVPDLREPPGEVVALARGVFASLDEAAAYLSEPFG